MSKEDIKNRTLEISVINKKIKNEILGCCNLNMVDIFDKFEKVENKEITEWFELDVENTSK
jgi:hypothetical protein